MGKEADLRLKSMHESKTNISLGVVSPRGTCFESIYTKCFSQSMFIKSKLSSE
jgi:hypothetical protein